MAKAGGLLVHTLEEQAQDAIEAFEAAYHDGTVAALTDHQINLLAAVNVLRNHLKGPGEVRFESGAVVRWNDEGGGLVSLEVPNGDVSLADFPDHIEKHMARIPPEEQESRRLQLALERSEKDRRQEEGE